MKKQTTAQKQFNEQMQNLANDFAERFMTGSISDYVSLIQELENPYLEAKKLGYNQSFLLFTTDIMEMVYNRIPDDMHIKDEFFIEFDQAQKDYEAAQRRKRINERLENPNERKNKGKNRGMSM
jgi:hypothetical protein